MKKNKVVTRIDLYPKGVVKFENFSNDIIDKAFEVRESPVTYKELSDLFADRCFPETWGNKKRLLKDLGVDFYDPRLIVEKTHGIMFDDTYWIRFEGEENLTYEEARRQAGL